MGDLHIFVVIWQLINRMGNDWGSTFWVNQDYKKGMEEGREITLLLIKRENENFQEFPINSDWKLVWVAN